MAVELKNMLEVTVLASSSHSEQEKLCNGLSMNLTLFCWKTLSLSTLLLQFWQLAIGMGLTGWPMYSRNIFS